MKIVLNKCFGGFGLSHEAKMEIFKEKILKYSHTSITLAMTQMMNTRDTQAKS